MDKYRINNEGKVVFAIKSEIEPLTSKPIVYSVRILPRGYIPTVFKVKFFNRINQYKTIYLAQEDEVENNQVVGHIEKLKASGQKVISLTSKKTLISELLIPSNLIITNDNDITLDKEQVQISVHSFDNTKIAFLPTDGLAQFPLNEKGIKLEYPFKISTFAASTKVQIFDNKGVVGLNLNQPIQIKLIINSNTINPKSGASIKINDTVDVFEFDEQARSWTKHKSQSILFEQNQYFVLLKANKVSQMIVGWSTDLCSEGPTFQIKSPYANVDINYLYQILDNTSNTVLREFYWPINTSTNYTIRNIEFSENKLKLRILNKSDFRGGDSKILAESKALNTCEKSTNAMDLMALKIADPIKVKFEVKCPNGEILDEKLIPLEMRTQIRISGEENWKYLGTFTRSTREIESYKLILKSTYDFRLSTDGGVTWPFMESNFKVNVKNWKIEIDASGYCK